MDIPTGIEDITVSWLDDALHAGGALPAEARVTDVEVGDLGVGRGFLSQTVRIIPTYEGPAEGAPRSIVGKVPTFVEMPDWLVPGMATFFQAEIGWYEHAAPGCPLRVPATYWGGFRSHDQYGLLMEDLGHLDTLSQHDSCSAEQARPIVEGLARAQARWWYNDELRRADWLPSLDRQIALYAPWVTDFWTAFAERWVPIVDPAFLPVGERLVDQIVSVFQRGVAAGSTLTHGDYRIENFLFGMPGSADEIVVVDWQLTGIGSGPRDMAYFIGQSLDRPTRRRLERELVELYHGTLVSNGVHDYSWDQCWDDYRLGLLSAIWIPITTNRGMQDVAPPGEGASIEDLQAFDDYLAAGNTL
ncbi:MAG TPA: phosphotransferase, partial [Dehalococcoidia bacterium]|nr:phosphotransferase [Dehalococcoidia bacterium]